MNKKSGTSKAAADKLGTERALVLFDVALDSVGRADAIGPPTRSCHHASSALAPLAGAGAAGPLDASGG